MHQCLHFPPQYVCPFISVHYIHTWKKLVVQWKPLVTAKKVDNKTSRMSDNVKCRGKTSYHCWEREDHCFQVCRLLLHPSGSIIPKPWLTGTHTNRQLDCNREVQ